MGEEVATRRLSPLRIALGVLLCGTLLGGGVAAWWVLYELPRLQELNEKQQLEVCRENLEQVVVACRMFRDGAGGGQRYPFEIRELIESGMLEATCLQCPSDRRGDRQTSYTYLGQQAMLVPASQFVLAYETFHNHGNSGRPGHLVAFADQRVAWVSTQELQAILRRQRSGPDR